MAYSVWLNIKIVSYNKTNWYQKYNYVHLCVDSVFHLDYYLEDSFIVKAPHGATDPVA